MPWRSSLPVRFPGFRHRTAVAPHTPTFCGRCCAIGSSTRTGLQHTPYTQKRWTVVLLSAGHQELTISTALASRQFLYHPRTLTCGMLVAVSSQTSHRWKSPHQRLTSTPLIAVILIATSFILEDRKFNGLFHHPGPPCPPRAMHPSAMGVPPAFRNRPFRGPGARPPLRLQRNPSAATCAGCGWVPISLPSRHRRQLSRRLQLRANVSTLTRGMREEISRHAVCYYPVQTWLFRFDLRPEFVVEP